MLKKNKQKKLKITGRRYKKKSQIQRADDYRPKAENCVRKRSGGKRLQNPIERTRWG